MPQRRNLQFFSLKCKLKSAVPDKQKRERIEQEVLAAHKLTKLGYFFFKAYCLHIRDVPPVTHATMLACLNQVSTKSPRGGKGKEDDLASNMRSFWSETFSKIIPERINMEGRSQLKARVIDQMLVCVLNNATTHLSSRCRKYIIHLGVEKRDSARVLNDVFRGRWELVPESIIVALREILSERVDSDVYIDLKKFPSKYVGATYRLSQAMPDGDICFAPLRRSCIPRHVKLDTEALAQIFVPHRKAAEARKAAGISNRLHYNDWVWGHVINRRVVDGKSRKYKFHHEIVTDGVSVSLLYSREDIQTAPTLGTDRKTSMQKGQSAGEVASSIPPSQTVGLDPGKKNVATMIDDRGVSLKYSTRQRAFESGTREY